MTTLLQPGQRARLITNETATALRDGSATIVALRPRQQYEVLLDDHDDKLPNAGRLVLWDAANTALVDHPDPATLHHPNDTETIRAQRAWTTLPYAGVPPHTSPGREHQIVAVFGISWSRHDYGGYVYGITACGKGRDGNLLFARSAFGFPKCKRCYSRGDTADRV